LVLLGCRASPDNRSLTRAAAPSTSPPPPSPPALTGSPLERLSVAGFRDAIVALPLGTTTKRRVMIAAHGNYDRPEWQCDTWRSILERAKQQAFVLCPRGVARTDSPSAEDIRFTYASREKFLAELDAALSAFREKYGAFAEDGPMIYTGFSLGAIYGVAAILRDPAKFPRAVLTEGSHDQWTPAAAATFASKGGQKILFACGQVSCVARSKGLKLQPIDVRVVHGKNVGHGYDGAVADEIVPMVQWLFE
jgi:hypothetical protein